MKTFVLVYVKSVKNGYHLTLHRDRVSEVEKEEYVFNEYKDIPIFLNRFYREEDETPQT